MVTRLLGSRSSLRSLLAAALLACGARVLYA